MIEPKSTDIDRPVIYRPRHGATERGVITSFNSQYVFVRYHGDEASKATRREDLTWTDAPTSPAAA